MSSSLNDLFLTNIPMGKLKAGVITVYLSNHLPKCICCRKHSCDKKKPETFITQRIHENTLNTFSKNILGPSWTNVLKINEPNNAYEEFPKIIQPIYAASFPLVKTKQNTRFVHPGLTLNLAKAFKKRTCYLTLS